MSERQNSYEEGKSDYSKIFSHWIDLFRNDENIKNGPEGISDINHEIKKHLIRLLRLLIAFEPDKQKIARQLAFIDHWSREKYRVIEEAGGKEEKILKYYCIPHRSPELSELVARYGKGELSQMEITLMKRKDFIIRLGILGAVGALVGTNTFGWVLRQFGIEDGDTKELPDNPEQLYNAHKDKIDEFAPVMMHTARVVVQNIHNRIGNKKLPDYVNKPEEVVALSLLLLMWNKSEKCFYGESEFARHSEELAEEHQSEVFSTGNSDLYSWFDEDTLESGLGLSGDELGTTNYDYLSISLAYLVAHPDSVPVAVRDAVSLLAKKLPKGVVEQQPKPKPEPAEEKLLDKPERKSTGEILDKKTLRGKNQKLKAFRSVPSGHLVNIESQHGIPTRETGDYVHRDIAPRLVKFYKELKSKGLDMYLTGARNGSGSPNTYVHNAKCHYTGRCVDAKFERGRSDSMNADDIITFCTIAKKYNLVVHYEDRSPGRDKAKKLKQAGIPIYGYDTMRSAYRHITGRHFSVYFEK